MSGNPYDNHHDNDDKGKDLDVDIKQDLDIDLDLDVDTKTESEYKVDVHSPPYVRVKIDIDEHKKVEEEYKVKFEERVDKDIDVSTWDVKVDVDSNNIIQDSNLYTEHDEDVNDIDSQELIDVSYGGKVSMDDFTARQLAVGKSFNGSGNDSQFSVRQSNNLVDNDKLIAPQVLFEAARSQDGGHHKPWEKDYGHDKGGDDPFQDVKVEGGRAYADDGIDGDIDDSANGNAGDGSVLGSALASADGVAAVSAFTQDIVMGANTQGNFATVNVVGGDSVQANDIDDHGGHGGGGYGGYGAEDGGDGYGGHGGHGGDDDGLAIKNSDITEIFDNDINDLDAQELISVKGSHLYMDDFTLDTTAVGSSFNGSGNDMQFDVGQVNDLVDNDFLYRPLVKYDGPSGTTFQEVDVYGGHASSGDGIHGKIDDTANHNGANGSITGSTTASADAIADVSAFTQNIVMGANLQLNNFDATVVGGDGTIADDIG